MCRTSLQINFEVALPALGPSSCAAHEKCPDLQEDLNLGTYVLRYQMENEGNTPCWEAVAIEVFGGGKSAKSCRLRCALQLLRTSLEILFALMGKHLSLDPAECVR